MDNNNRQPNIVIVITDDQGYGDLGCTGNPILKTPNIDEFYDESVHLQNFHVGPTCAPTRAGIMTGHYANSTGVWHTIGGRSLLRKDEVTIADALRSAGYRTGLFGKWHLGDNYPYRPQDRGFDEVVTHGGGGISQTPDYWGNDYFDDTYSVNGELKKFDGYCTDVWFQEATRFIKSNRDRPFFCYIAPNAPHSPYNVESNYSAPYRDHVSEDRANFFGMIANIDENFGQLRHALADLDIEDDTILIFMTDNGTSEGVKLDESEFVVDGFNAGMRGMKGSKYDGGHRVPLFLRWVGGALATKRDIPQLTANIDIMPTLLDLCGIELDAFSFHGDSIKPLLYGSEDKWAERTIVTDSQRLTTPVKWRKSSVMTDLWRLIDGEELYNIEQDPEQRNNIAKEHPERVASLRSEYDVWWNIVSQQFEEEIPISVGKHLNEVTTLTCHDWRNDTSDSPWHQGLIRQGYQSVGYWELWVEQAGIYEVKLHRWPPYLAYKLGDGIKGDDVTWRRDVISDQYKHWYSEGVALRIEQATLRFTNSSGDDIMSHSQKIEDDLNCVSFQGNLPIGNCYMVGEFHNNDGLHVGAYFVTVEFIG